MTDIKRMPIREFKDLGFLQEANRQFFHPHGLALEITRITEEDATDGARPPLHNVALGAPEFELLQRILADSALRASSTLDRLRQLVEQATRYDVDDAFLSGVWDYRDDPEGVLYGDLRGDDDALEKAEAVFAQRLRHAQTRYQLFHGDGAVEIDQAPDDVEPLGWIYPD